MFIKSIILNNFKNHIHRDFSFSSQINCFAGDNGAGKTNILDALHYISVGKSFLGNSDINNISRNQDFFSINAIISNNEKDDNIKIIQSKDSRKIIKKNEKNYSKISEHIGYLPSVIISPYDQNIISDSSESRRKFLDSTISQTDSEYLFDIIQYQKILQQRNALLKSFQRDKYFDYDTINIYNEPMVTIGKRIYSKRNFFVKKISPILQQYYSIISNEKEIVSIKYKSDLEQDFSIILKENLEKDRILTYTSKGTHRDDLLLNMDENSIKKEGSQGQQKSFLIALKLAQMNIIKNSTNKTPILLLDDIFDKLDNKRVYQLIELVNQEHFGQIFITDTHKDRIQELVKNINNSSKIFEI